MMEGAIDCVVAILSQLYVLGALIRLGRNGDMSAD